MKHFCFCILFLLLPLHATASSVVFAPDDYTITGFNDVNVGGLFYDVTFSDAYDGVSREEGATFAEAASWALVSTFEDHVEGSGSTLGSNYSISGCTITVLSCFLHTSYDVTTYVGLDVGYETVATGDIAFFYGSELYEIHTEFVNLGVTYANWTSSAIATTPLPGALVFMVTGLLGLVGLRRKAQS